MGVKIRQIDRSQPTKREELDEIFEEILRPLQSRNARHIFLVLRDSETEYLTTYDIQPILEKLGNKLNKVELNNWLSALLEAGLVQKASERGKPTTRPYNRRYTFDLWKLSQKGRETASLLEVFNGNTPTLTREKVVTKTIEKTVEIQKLPALSDARYGDLDDVEALGIHLSLLHTLSSVDHMDLMTLSEKTGYNPQRIVEFIKDQEKSDSNTLYLLSKISLDLRGKIMQTIGLSPKKNYDVSLSPMGYELASSLSS